ncbi:uncharacterized protein L201_002430 [Kwoniella dendrophila CBS 6074]|uniref:Uncharacterized protein n=1 Tax=Kwoniella dendrophila CBS 6074 TaxID=1295534 RepID=A0AAX4JSG0_9TREE
MGSSASKVTRKLPTSVASSASASKTGSSSTVLSNVSKIGQTGGTGSIGKTSDAQPSELPYGGHPPPDVPTTHDSSVEPPKGEEADPFMEAPTHLEQGLGGETRTPSNQDQQGNHPNQGGRGAQIPAGGSPGRLTGSQDKMGLARGGMGRLEFSGNKDDAIKRDSMDPQFMNNLSMLGQVRIRDAGKFVPAQAQRTLLSRSANPELSSNIPSINHLTINLLVSLLDQLKSSSAKEASKLYKEYGIKDIKLIEDIRKYVNSVSVSENDSVRIEDGEEIREMNAVWIGGLAK